LDARGTSTVIPESTSSGGPPEPAYRFVADRLRDGILSGTYSPGERLPTELETAAEFGVSRQTVRRAFELLVSQALVRRVRGSGTYATPEKAGGRYTSFGSLDELLAMSADIEVIRPLEMVVDPVSATRLALDNDRVTTCVLRRSSEGQIMLVSEICMPPRFTPVLSKVPELTKAGSQLKRTLMRILEDGTRGLIAATIDQSITAVALPPLQASWLGCPAGTPALKNDQAVKSQDGVPMEVSVTYYHPRHYSYRARMQRKGT
jgi:GntR family transcriptional regulator